MKKEEEEEEGDKIPKNSEQLLSFGIIRIRS